MLTYLFAVQNFPFAVAMAIVMAIAVLEGVLTLLGFGMSAFLDGLGGDVDVDIDIPDADADIDADFDGANIDGGNSLGAILGWLRFGEVPAVVLLIIFLSAFSAIGFAVQGLSNVLTGFYLPSLVACIPAFFGAMPVVRVLGGAIGKIMPKEETSAVTLQALVGRVATITLGTASTGRPAQGKVRDEHGLDHYVMIEPDEEQQTFVQGSQVLLVRNEGATFFAIVNEHEALSRQS